MMSPFAKAFGVSTNPGQSQPQGSVGPQRDAPAGHADRGRDPNGDHRRHLSPGQPFSGCPCPGARCCNSPRSDVARGRGRSDDLREYGGPEGTQALGLHRPAVQLHRPALLDASSSRRLIPAAAEGRAGQGRSRHSRAGAHWRVGPLRRPALSGRRVPFLFYSSTVTLLRVRGGSRFWSGGTAWARLAQNWASRL